MSERTLAAAMKAVIIDARQSLRASLPSPMIDAFGPTDRHIGRIIAINLDRQPQRWRRLLRELSLFRAADGRSLTDLTDRFAAIDALSLDARTKSPDISLQFPMCDQLFVQPDPTLEECFGPDQLISITRQEIAVAQSHIAVWRLIANGPDNFVLVLEDDAYFTLSARGQIERGWREAYSTSSNGGRSGGPDLFYFSYQDAGGTMERAEIRKHTFRPVRGLWYLSGYVLSRDAALRLLDALPVVGPVDTWMNRRFIDLEVRALSHPAILQRRELGSDNNYSILPYLERAGVFAPAARSAAPKAAGRLPVFAWNIEGSLTDTAGMALSMLGYRVFSQSHTCSQTRNEKALSTQGFNAFVDVGSRDDGIRKLASEHPDARLVWLAGCDQEAELLLAVVVSQTPEISGRSLILNIDRLDNPWKALCDFLDVKVPPLAFPVGAENAKGVFSIRTKDGRLEPMKSPGSQRWDNSPWIATAREQHHFDIQHDVIPQAPREGRRYYDHFMPMKETFHANLARNSPANLVESDGEILLTMTHRKGQLRPFTSASKRAENAFAYGCLSAEIKAAPAPGTITELAFLRIFPRQEIRLQLSGGNVHAMIANVLFNPGDEDSAFEYGHLGTPVEIELDFDVTREFHEYSIDWSPEQISWGVDGRTVHQRRRWNPTPIPHLPAYAQLSLWAPLHNGRRSFPDPDLIPTSAVFRKICLETFEENQE